MKVTVTTLNAFSKNAQGGNPAGVVCEAGSLTDAMMQQVAKKVRYSETAFIFPSDKADFKVRFFTPVTEIEFCGHATVGTFYHLLHQGTIKAGQYLQETKVGVLKVQVSDDGVVYMDQNLPQFFDTVEVSDVAKSLRIPVSKIADDLPIQIISTGLKDIIVPLRSLDDLYSIKPHFDRISTLCQKHQVVGYHCFTQETQFNSTAHCRNFAPLYGVPEESATGSAAGALSSYLFTQRRIDQKKAEAIVFEQGYVMEKPSEVLACLQTSGSQIQRVQVGGRAVSVKETNINL